MNEYSFITKRNAGLSSKIKERITRSLTIYHYFNKLKD